MAACAGMTSTPSSLPSPPVNSWAAAAAGAHDRSAGPMRCAPPAASRGLRSSGDATGQVGDWEEQLGSNKKVALMAGKVEDAALGSPMRRPMLRRSAGRTARSDPADDLGRTGVQGSTGGRSSTLPGVRRPAGHGREADHGPDRDQPRPGDRAGLGVQPAGNRGSRYARRHLPPREHQRPPPLWNPNDPPVGLSIDSATGTVDGKQLTVTFVGAPDPGDKPCGADYTAEAVESSTAVVVIVIEHHNANLATSPSFSPTAHAGCRLVGARRTAAVQLAAPLGDRAVLEVKEGLPVPVTLAP